MSKYTDRIECLMYVAKNLLQNKLLTKQTQELRKISDAMEIIGHPRNPAFFPFKLPEDDPCRIKYEEFQRSYGDVCLKIFQCVESEHSFEAAKDLARYWNFGRKAKIIEYVDEILSNISRIPQETAFRL